MEKKNLYILAGLIWGIPGVILSVKGINADIADKFKFTSPR